MEELIPLATKEEALALFGLADRNLKLLQDSLGVRIAARNHLVRLEGEDPAIHAASAILHRLLGQVRRGERPADDFVEKEIYRLQAGPEPEADSDSVRDEAEAVGAGEPEADGDPRSEPLADRSGQGAAGGGPASEPLPGAAQAPRSSPLPESGDAPSPAGGGTEAGPRRERGRKSFRRPLNGAERALQTSLARSPGQAEYIEAMLHNELVFCVGPAGTGKTFLAVQLAVHYLRAGEIRRLILCRPAVEAGEKLGYLPGDFHAKVNPYLRPLYDALNDILGYEQVKRYVEREIIEIVPLAYMRGRTLNHAFIILDEGQNTTASQMKMFLTRMGSHSRIVVNGDITQADLPAGQLSGLVHARDVVRGLAGVAWCSLRRQDIVRHPLVQRIVEAYEAHEMPAERPSDQRDDRSAGRPDARDDRSPGTTTGRVEAEGG